MGVVFRCWVAVSQRVAGAEPAALADCEQPVAAAGYHEPSLVYLVGTTTRLVDGAGAADFLHLGGCRFALVEARPERNFLRRADAIGLRYASGPRIDGYNFSAGDGPSPLRSIGRNGR